MSFFTKMAKSMSDALEETVKDAVEDVLNNDEKQAPPPASAPRAEGGLDGEFDDKIKVALPGVIRMISGCADHQTSADVSNTASFELPEDAGPGGGGGACTSALLSSLNDNDDRTWVQLLDSMRVILKAKGFEQIPQLSSSRKMDMESGKFSLLNPQGGGKRRAVLIGINYVGQRGELRGCHNDVLSMKLFIEKHGFQEDEIRVLMDDGQSLSPTGQNILEAFDWLVDDAEAGDSLFMHYSGHGGYVNDTNGDEADKRDETVVPVDFKEAGQIIDDVIFKELVMPVPAGCQLTCVMDCCHSGSVFDLPYYVKATEQLEGTNAQMQQNPGFSFQQLLSIAKKLYALKSGGASSSELAQHAAKEIMPMLMSAKKPQGGLGNLMSMFGGAAGGSSGGLPSLPF